MAKDTSPKEAKTGDNSDVDVDFDALTAFLTDMKDKKKGISSATGTLRSALKAYLDNSGLHPKAVAIIRQLDDMNITQRNDVLRSLNPLLDIMDAKFWIDQQDDFLDKTSTEAK